MITKHEAIDVLNAYMLGKDTNQPGVLATMFAEDAVVSFDIKPSIIQFPDQIVGREAIANTMFGDFHQLFTDVKSYYLSDDFPHLAENQINNQKWLVAMKERDSGNHRIGTGTYDWLFEFSDSAWRVKRVHIVIEEMVSFANDKSHWLTHLQQQLHRYPWATQQEAAAQVADQSELQGVYRYLQDNE